MTVVWKEVWFPKDPWDQPDPGSTCRFPAFHGGQDDKRRRLPRAVRFEGASNAGIRGAQWLPQIPVSEWSRSLQAFTHSMECPEKLFAAVTTAQKTTAGRSG